MTDEKKARMIAEMLSDYDEQCKASGLVPTEKFNQIEECVELAQELADINGGEMRLEYSGTTLDIIMKSITFGVTTFEMPKFQELVNKCDLMGIHVEFKKNGDEMVVIELSLNDVLKPA